MRCTPFQPPLFVLYDSRAAGIERLLRRMCFDDVLVRRGYRLEYLRLDTGLPHYRLYRRGALIGVVRLHNPDDLGYRDREVAMFLAMIGFSPDNTHLVECGAETPEDATTEGLPYLFWYDAESARKRRAGKGLP